MKAHIRIMPAESTGKDLPAEPGLSLLQTLQDGGIYLPALCGGEGRCGKCRIRVSRGELPVTAADRHCLSQAQLDAGYRLACAAFPQEDLDIELCETGEQDFSTVNAFEQDHEEPLGLRETLFSLTRNAQSYARQVAGDRRLSYSELQEVSKLADTQGRILEEPSVSGTCHIYREQGKILHISGKPESLYAVAVDIGTTTLVLALVDLQTGQIIGRFSAVNRQREFGADVISRIQRANTGDLSLLSRSVRTQISQGIAALCLESAVNAKTVKKIALVGNTTMLHLLLHMSCATLGQAPFTPVTLDMLSLGSGDLFAGDLACETVILPGISTYVGADITAGLLFAGIHTKADPVVFMDIGTNGELALAYQGSILCTATAAGPAFEGGNIRWGTGSVPGAISQARFRDGTWACTTIGNRPPVGICGSGVVDIVYQGLKADCILSSGRLNTELLPAGELLLAKNPEGRDIVFCQKDVRELQLGKSAIRTGLDALLNHAGLAYGDIHRLYLSGGFGYKLNLESSMGIGLIPQALGRKISLLGNSALGGAVQFLLNPDHEETLYRLVDHAQEFSLPQDGYFTAHFIDNLTFD
ncbi:MAG: ASKHA domain-containing protein [Treponema sp.]|nr:ASKHA domain-containing protein [Treponema sp.]